MDEQFYAALKLITGEEVLARAMLTEENGEEIFILDDPIVVPEASKLDPDLITAKSGLIPRKWLNYGGDGLCIVYKKHVITVSEMDQFGADFYEKALLSARVSSPVKKRVKQQEHSGYLGSTDDYRKYLEDMYNRSHDIPE